MGCKDCQKSENTCEKLPPVLEIVNEECPVLFHTVEVPVSAGDDTTPGQTPADYQANGFKNVLLVYQANKHKYLFSSDGIPTRLGDDTVDFDALVNRPKYGDTEMTSTTVIPNVNDAVAAETEARQTAIAALSSAVDANATAISSEASTRASADANLQSQIDTLSGESSDLSSALAAEVTARQDGDDALGTRLTAAEGDIVTVNGDLSNEVTTRQSEVSALTTALNGKADTAAVQSIRDSLNTEVMTDLTVGGDGSTVTVTLTESKRNLLSGETETVSEPLPVASTTQAGVVNTATFQAIQSNTDSINAILSGSVSIAGLSASPSQADLTTAWQTATGLATVINGAKINDSDNNKVWTYYTNTSTWYAATNTAQVTVSQWTNSSAGIVKGSTVNGQIFAESNGTGSVNGWDTMSSNLSNVRSRMTTAESAITALQNSSIKLTLSTTDIGEGATLAANTLYGVYE